MKPRYLPISIALLLMVHTTATAQSNVLRGKVRSTDGVTVNNAIVELRYGGGAMISQTVTRNDGDFAFGSLAPGEYEVAVTIAGFNPAVQMARFNQPGRMNFS